MAKFDFRGATVGTQTIIEQQLGNLQINSHSVLPGDRIDEVTSRIRTIRDDLLTLDSRDPQVVAAVEHVNGALAVAEGTSKEPARMIDHLKAAGTALVETGKVASAASAIIAAISATAVWIASIAM
jgi:hypothetical protein